MKKLFLSSPVLWSLLSFVTVYGGNPLEQDLLCCPPEAQAKDSLCLKVAKMRAGYQEEEFGEGGGGEEPIRLS